ncbi:MAG: ferrochelatase [Deltaproteobacteria bacterium]|nr:ferrochelatase [Deltaproteobacteria bacterium]
MTGLLLCNLGTPDDPSPASVRRYLRQFLADPRVLDINAVGRWALLNLIILPFRPRKSAAAYQKIWTKRGSPLLTNSEDLVTAVRARLGTGWAVELGMRYQNPSFESALDKLRAAGADRVVVFPLYPQYSASSTGSSVEEVFRLAGQPWVTPTLSFVEPFYDDAAFIDAFASQGRGILETERADHVLFSFHGLPERHMRKADATGKHCLASANCCDSIVPANRHCYRAQCFATARALAARLSLPEGKSSVSFQSRLGRTPWIRPYTDIVLLQLAAQGKKRVVVFCPAFVADCLETLEEIGIRGQHDFIAAGGERLTLVPSLNASPAWADAVVQLVRRQAQRFGDTTAKV